MRSVSHSTILRRLEKMSVIFDLEKGKEINEKKDKIIHQEELNLNSLNTTLSFNLNETPDLIVLDYKCKFINKARKNYFEFKN